MSASPSAIRELRPFIASDRRSVIELWRRCGLTRPWNDPDKDIDRKLTVQPELFLVAAGASGLVGSVMAGYDGHRGTVFYLAVDPDFRDQGVGRYLMAAVEERLLALGCPKINLQVRASNGEALAFYDAIGYRQDDVFVRSKRLIPDD
jgi:ribosomal protein S18 acetylase RimI-like enzyme